MVTCRPWTRTGVLKVWADVPGVEKRMEKNLTLQKMTPDLIFYFVQILFMSIVSGYFRFWVAERRVEQVSMKNPIVVVPLSIDLILFPVSVQKKYKHANRTANNRKKN